jgi:hypothetical protein
VRDDGDLPAAPKSDAELDEARHPALQRVERVVHRADGGRIDERGDRLAAKISELEAEELHGRGVSVADHPEPVGDEIRVRCTLEEIGVAFTLGLEAEAHATELVGLCAELFLRDHELLVLDAHLFERITQHVRVLLEGGARPEELRGTRALRLQASRERLDAIGKRPGPSPPDPDGHHRTSSTRTITPFFSSVSRDTTATLQVMVLASPQAISASPSLTRPARRSTAAA